MSNMNDDKTKIVFQAEPPASEEFVVQLMSRVREEAKEQGSWLTYLRPQEWIVSSLVFALAVVLLSPMLDQESYYSVDSLLNSQADIEFYSLVDEDSEFENFLLEDSFEEL